MVQPKNRFLRIAVPLMVMALGLAVAFAVFVNTGQQTPAPTLPPPGPALPPQATPGPGNGPAQPFPAGAPLEPPESREAIPGLALEVFEDSPLTRDFAPLGDLGPRTDYAARLDFSNIGAGLRAITLAKHYKTIEESPENHVVIQWERGLPPERPESVITPFAALGVEINGTMLDLTGLGRGPVWRQIAPEQPGAFEALVIDGDGRRIARLERVYELLPGSYLIRLRQRVFNLTDRPLSIRWMQFGPVDLEKDVVVYVGDRRRVRFGYLLRPAADPSRQIVLADEYFWDRGRVLGSADQMGAYPEVEPVWPNRQSTTRGYEHVWAGMTNRYFGVAAHSLFDLARPAPDVVFHEAAHVDRVVAQWPGIEPVIALRLLSDAREVAPGDAADLSMGVYAGPLERPRIARDALARAAGLTGLVVYNLGGPCWWCTFDWITGALLELLRIVHFVLRDWALAIIVLVVIVRTALHPVTRWSQVRIQRFGKQLQDLAPKQKKLQERFKDDPKKQREEMARLWREEGVNPAGALGCLPMFLQTPIWIALYATLFFAFELRHEGAFFGVFQWVSGGRWSFLGDLAEPDRFIHFGRDLFWLPLLGPISSFNILPIVLGVVFYMQQKYLTPPTSATLTPEQQMQQKTIKVMMVVMFPVIMYNVPSGLAVYFIANSVLGILESRWIRAHITKHDLLVVKKKPGRAGFLKRMQEMAEARQKQLQARSPRAGGQRGGPAQRGGPPRRGR